MRWNLLKTYDKIYTIDLHGNTKKKEKHPDGSADVNVFDIEQGVSINIFVKTGKKKATELGKVFHYDLFGKRELKYDFLTENSLKSISFNSFTPFKNSFLFKSLDEKKLLKYNEGINPVNLFQVNVMGFQTHRDDFAIDFEMNEIRKRAKDLINKELSNEDIFKKYPISDNRDWKLSKARAEIQSDINWEKKAIHCGYRPFDNRPCYFSYVMMDYPRKELIQNVLGKENLLIGIGRQGLVIGDIEWCLTTVSKNPVDANIFRRGGVNLFPLYLYPETNGQKTIGQTTERTPNLNAEIVKQISEKLGLSFTNEKETTENTFAPIDILDYIYAVLHSPTYREKYKEFLKIDFPRVPYPKAPSPSERAGGEVFWQLVKLGGEIRQIHLLESPTVENYITQYPEDGDNIVTKPRFSYSPPSEGCPQGGVVNCAFPQGDVVTSAFPQGDVVTSVFPHGDVVTSASPQGDVVDSPSEGNMPPQLSTILPEMEGNDKPLYINSIKLRLNPVLELPYNPTLKKRARELRQAENLPEVLFWMQVTKGGFHKIDFDRQRVIGNYIVDLYVKKLGLVIEIDGSSHIGKEEYDKEREDYLRSLGLEIYRIQVVDILKRMGNVMHDLENFIVEKYGEIDCVEVGMTKPPRPTGTPPQEGNLGRVYINDTQYFDNVPEVAWNFFIGGYQPAQKWLKDRKGRTLEFDDILHYQKIIVALSETDRLMKEIEKIEIE